MVLYFIFIILKYNSSGKLEFKFNKNLGADIQWISTFDIFINKFYKIYIDFNGANTNIDDINELYNRFRIKKIVLNGNVTLLTNGTTAYGTWSNGSNANS